VIFCQHHASRSIVSVVPILVVTSQYRSRIVISILASISSSASTHPTIYRFHQIQPTQTALPELLLTRSMLPVRATKRSRLPRQLALTTGCNRSGLNPVSDTNPAFQVPNLGCSPTRVIDVVIYTPRAGTYHRVLVSHAMHMIEATTPALVGGSPRYTSNALDLEYSVGHPE
jgi:hypothetical protein